MKKFSTIDLLGLRHSLAPDKKFVFLLFMLFSVFGWAQVKTTFSYTGTDQTFTVPAGVTQLTVKMWGAGGSGGYYGGGGTGAYVTGTLNVNPGDNLTIVVGQGGKISTSTVTASYGGGGIGGYQATQKGGGGGGYSGIFSNTPSQATALAIAGGGGGGAGYASAKYPHGGGGGAANGFDGLSTGSDAYAGKAGTTSAGGAAGTAATGGTVVAPTAGTALTGGNAGRSATSGSTATGGGGAGGGYYGGGGGGTAAGNNAATGGGGGGASYTAGTGFSGTNTMGNTFGSATAPTANNTNVPGSTDGDYVSGIGAGGSYTPAAGGNGLVIISYPNGDDASLVAITSPICSGNQNVTATLKNVGKNTLTSAVISWTINGNPQADYHWSGSLTNGQSAVVTLGSYTFATATAYTIVATIDPTLNGSVTDADTSNNSASLNTQTGLSGTYTIGASGNFTSLTAAIAQANSYGLCGPTVFSLGTDYSSSGETFPITINNPVGANSTNLLTIKPAEGSTPTISGSSASGPIIKLVKSGYIVIDGSNTVGGTTKDLTIKNTSTTTPSVVWIGSDVSSTPANNIVLKNTTFVNATSATAIALGTGNAIAAGYFNNITIQNNEIQSAYNGIYAAAQGTGNSLTVTGNTLTSGIVQYGILISGVDGNSVVSNNIISTSNSTAGTSSTASYTAGINIGAGTNNANIFGNTVSAKNTATSTTNYYNIIAGITVGADAANVSTKIHDNIINGLSGISPYVNSAGIYVSGATPNVSIYNNKVSGIRSTYNAAAGTLIGICLGSTSTAANTIVYNNFIWDVTATGAGGAKGLYVFAGGGYKIYHNTINLNTSNSETGTGGALFVGTSANITTSNAIDLRNNILVNNQTSGTRLAIYSGSANTVFSNIDNNDYYSTGSVGYLTSLRADLEAWQTATGKDANSVNIEPIFASETDLHLTTANTTLDNLGTPLAEVTVDIDGDARSATTPDMGADEFSTPTMAVSDVNKANISVYPNPFTDVLKISDVKGVKSISVNDMSGRQVRVLAPASELNLSNLKEGLYIVNLQMEDGSTKSIKAIKK